MEDYITRTEHTESKRNIEYTPDASTVAPPKTYLQYFCPPVTVTTTHQISPMQTTTTV